MRGRRGRGFGRLETQKKRRNFRNWSTFRGKCRSRRYVLESSYMRLIIRITYYTVILSECGQDMKRAIL
jgi:hypothetical protein